MVAPRRKIQSDFMVGCFVLNLGYKITQQGSSLEYFYLGRAVIDLAWGKPILKRLLSQRIMINIGCSFLPRAW